MILIIATTNRRNSKTYKIAEYYQRLLLPYEVESSILSLEHLPPDFVFSALYENAGRNEDFNRLQDRMAEADKYVFIVPEYNASFPGVLKSFLDGLGWPSVMKGKLTAMVGISDGVMGGVHALSHLTDVFHYLGCHVLPTLVRIPLMKKNFTEGEVQDDFIRELLAQQAEQLVESPL
jgi:chromate reductase, NAD(P)H dehydrogenase (quinone)